ncbi:HAD-IA family hydrolase [Kitasatospora sp. NBC_00240]|uniref:HAD family hydrolase n=1 Tax=Kitasatospora sp. NBC_00240 TaxID=2903567 RepID=UPI002257F6E7|nr:HAD-IA family hydrolase [Kitasatospora sp. NBC_00240]MCX5208079.1 HAD-IA family hydrolase [Kitasatospora sp. NBC_00240]
MTISTTRTAAPFDAVLSDLDDVIRRFDSTEVTRLERAAGLPVGSTAGSAFGPGRGEPLVLGQLTRDAWVESTASGLADRVPPDRARELAAAFARAPFRTDPEVVELLRAARAHCPVWIVTNGTPWLDQDLATIDLDGLADGIVNSARVGIAKPDPGILLHAAERAGAAPERCLFVDDRLANVEAAAAVGMTTVHFRTASDLRPALAPLLARPVPHPRR